MKGICGGFSKQTSGLNLQGLGGREGSKENMSKIRDMVRAGRKEDEVHLRRPKDSGLAPGQMDREARQGCGWQDGTQGTLSALLGGCTLSKGKEAPWKSLRSARTQGSGLGADASLGKK